MDADKAVYAQKTSLRTLAEVIDGANIFLSLSAGGVLKQDMVRRMAPRPLVLALANPTPEIMPEEIKAVHDDALIATGRLYNISIICFAGCLILVNTAGPS